jgi:pimeloyl-ACP methyl ester carboxylesterase
LAVVYWDQRGAGKSFDHTMPRSSITVEQFVADLGELVDGVCARLGKTKVAIFGHSWGSALGMLYAARFPAKVAAYVEHLGLLDPSDPFSYPSPVEFAEPHRHFLSSILWIAGRVRPRILSLLASGELSECHAPTALPRTLSASSNGCFSRA